MILILWDSLSLIAASSLAMMTQGRSDPGLPGSLPDVQERYVGQ